MSAGQRLRVLLVCGSLPPMRCGVGDYTASLGAALAGTGEIEVAVLTSRCQRRSAGSEQLAGLEVLEPIGRWDISALGHALNAVRSWNPDVIHIQHPAQGYDGALPFVLGPAVRLHLRLPVVATLHEAIAVSRQLPGMIALVRSANAVVVVRPDFRALLGRGLGWVIARKDVRLIPNTSSLPRVERTPQRVRSVRERFGIRDKALVAYFGFVYPRRGVDQLFQIADPKQHHLVIVGDRLDEAARFYDQVSAMARQDHWAGSCSMVGFLPAEQAAEVLACAEAVVLPFVGGGGIWNTSIHGARLQGTFVLTTSREHRGYDSRQNVYYAQPGSIAEMREALVRHLGARQEPYGVPGWEDVAAEHRRLYTEICRS